MKKKSILTVILSLVLVSVIGIGSTLAFMTAKTVEKHNVFTAGAALTGALKEENFDFANYGETRETTAVAWRINYNSELDSPHLGINRAKQVIPGRVIPKDPIVKNTSDVNRGTSAWVAIKLDAKFNNQEMTSADALTEIEKIATIDWGTTWVKDVRNGNVYFFYQHRVDPNQETTNLFKNITMKSDIDVSQIKDFSIDVSASLVQCNGVDSLQTLGVIAKEELVKLLDPQNPS